MAESIVTLGIGATPVSLTPFVTSGLNIGAELALQIYTASVSVNLAPTQNVKVNLLPSASVTANPTPTREVKIG